MITAKKSVAVASCMLAFVSFARVAVLFLEALSAVRDERAQDYELLELCRSGSARGSTKMRAACLQAAADRASPVVLKAVLRAVSIAWGDFSESVSSPGKLAIVLLFVLSSVFLPINSWLRALVPTETPPEGSSHVVVLAQDAAAALGRPRLGFRRRVSRALRMRRQRSVGPDDDDEGYGLRITELPGDEERPTGDCAMMMDVNLDGSRSTYGHAKWD